jgi:hypothetical protein
MKKIIYCLVFIASLSCSKQSHKDEAGIVVCPEPSMEWLNAKKAEYGSCHCLTGFRQGIYMNQPVIEIYGFDPLCDGINIVYKADGTEWFNSSDITIYADYTANVKDRKIIWTCSKGNG